MTFIFMSPNFPLTYWKFCRELQQNGATVLGIGDCAYDALDPQLRASMTEYYKVGSLENYDEVYRAVAFFSYKYGKIDWLESNNEYWLEQDARLRTDFNIGTGYKSGDMDAIKYKSKMKANYQAAGLPTARYHLVDNWDGCKWFIGEVGYPVIVKPDNGVGASDTHKLNNDDDLAHFFATKMPVQYIMEEYVQGVVCSYDAIVGADGEPIFETGNVSPVTIMDIVNEGGSCFFYIEKSLPDEVRAAGRATVRSFGVRSRFIHLEFFRLERDQAIGKAGQIVPLEVNMRPCGGFTPEMINYANSVDVYKLYADMVCFNRATIPLDGQHYYCAFVGRRDGRNYANSHDDALARFGGKICQEGPMPDALASAMGNYLYMARLDTKEEVDEFAAYMLREI